MLITGSKKFTAVREIGNRDKKFGKNGARPRRPQGTASPSNLKIWIWWVLIGVDWGAENRCAFHTWTQLQCAVPARCFLASFSTRRHQACRGSSLRSWLAIGPLSPFIRRLSSQVPLRKLALWISQRADFVENQCLGRGRVAEHGLSSAGLNHLVFRRRNESPVDARRGGEPQYFPQNSGTDVCQRYFSTF